MPSRLRRQATAVVFFLIVWYATKRSGLRLKYGIYWDGDKNPHCPSCRTPLANYNEYTVGKGYYCNPCEKVFPLADVSGKSVEPLKAIAEL